MYSNQAGYEQLGPWGASTISQPNRPEPKMIHWAPVPEREVVDITAIARVHLGDFFEPRLHWP